MIRSAKTAVFFLPLWVSAAWTGNGINDIGYGSDSASMASADVALARDTAALNNNPAGLVQIKSQTLDVLLEPFSSFGIEHSDRIGNDTRIDNLIGGGIGGGYARRLPGTAVVAGVGLFFQGGVGFVYNDFATPFGNRDDLSGVLGSVKIAPGFGWAINERWSVGSSAGLIYSTARQKFFPGTSTADFSGFRVDSLSGVSVNAKAGLQYRPAQDWVLALVYTSKAPIRLEDGTVTVNNTGSGGGSVHYKDARLTGLAFAQEVNAGFLYRASPRWSLAADLTWSDWSEAMRYTTLTARDADDAAAEPEFRLKSPLDWRDQYLISVGTLFRWTSATELRAGFSHARNPIPESTLNPVFSAIAENSVSAGFTHRLGPIWNLNFAATWQPPVKVKYDSALTGPSTERFEVTVLYFTFSRRW